MDNIAARASITCDDTITPGPGPNTNCASHGLKLKLMLHGVCICFHNRLICRGSHAEGFGSPKQLIKNVLAKGGTMTFDYIRKLKSKQSFDRNARPDGIVNRAAHEPEYQCDLLVSLLDGCHLAFSPYYLRHISWVGNLQQ